MGMSTFAHTVAIGTPGVGGIEADLRRHFARETVAGGITVAETNRYELRIDISKGSTGVMVSLLPLSERSGLHSHGTCSWTFKKHSLQSTP